MISLRTHIALGRVSNLPTVWTNALAGAALATAAPDPAAVLAAMLALSLFYVGGMYLNDAFDAEIDARERAGRPIPTGQIVRGAVFTIGAGLLAAGAAFAFALGIAAGVAGLALVAAVVLYDWLHKRTALAPLLMGACRFLSYLVAALAVAVAAAGLPAAVLVGATGLFAHVVGLTYAARQEAYDRLDRAWPLAVLALPVLVGLWFAAAGPGSFAFVLLGAYLGWSLWALRFLVRRRKGDVPRAVVALIAGISLYDATLVTAAGAPVLAGLAVLGFLATLALQRVAPGT